MFVATCLGVLILSLKRSKAGSIVMADNLSIPADHEAERLNKFFRLEHGEAFITVKPLDQLQEVGIDRFNLGLRLDFLTYFILTSNSNSPSFALADCDERTHFILMLILGSGQTNKRHNAFQLYLCFHTYHALLRSTFKASSTTRLMQTSCSQASSSTFQ